MLPARRQGRVCRFPQCSRDSPLQYRSGTPIRCCSLHRVSSRSAPWQSPRLPAAPRHLRPPLPPAPVRRPRRRNRRESRPPRRQRHWRRRPAATGVAGMRLLRVAQPRLKWALVEPTGHSCGALCCFSLSWAIPLPDLVDSESDLQSPRNCNANDYRYQVLLRICNEAGQGPEPASAELQRPDRLSVTLQRYMPDVDAVTPDRLSPECTCSKKTSSEERGHFSVTATPRCISTSPVCTRSAAAP